ncbi:hypothetical protein CU097_014234 [Rhizopus azygosporus]|uniref:Uncharacterized protein n=2 Tax=Rhizopus TaxID=4842 RepID=A0A367KBU4_RHIAZ|nr:hypothetical protein BCV71DRAFT_267950 [Rhizopus microsporus]RCH99648.1 hypothetical protein CU097_014234 [Rhizopus azygosporus]
MRDFLKDAKDAVLPIGDEIVNFERVSSEAMDFCRGIVDRIKPIFNLIGVVVKKYCLHFENDNYAIPDNSESK